MKKKNKMKQVIIEKKLSILKLAVLQNQYLDYCGHNKRMERVWLL